MTRLAVVGAGSWGTALSIALSQRFSSVSLWARDADRAARIREHGENLFYLPGYQLPANVHVTHDIGETIAGAAIVLLAIPSSHLRHVLQCAGPHLNRTAILVSASKGIEESSLMRMSEVVCNVVGSFTHHPVAVLSGPTFAKEIAAGEPAAVVIASEQVEAAAQIQRAFATASFRLYASSDVTGVEIGAALKNVIAIGAGVCRGLGLGSNSVAALVTRGLAEITRLAVKLGAHPRTLSGLGGLGDLVLTATGDLSRNRSVGIQLGEGHSLENVMARMTMVAEGVSTCRAAYRLGIREAVDLPIVNNMYQLLYERKEPRNAIRDLMERPLTNE